jgi:hypothetical protein
MSLKQIESIEEIVAFGQSRIDTRLVSVKHKSVNIDYKDGRSVFIGLPTCNGVMIENVLINDQCLLDVYNILNQKTKAFYSEDGSLIVSKELGVTCYFEDEKIREIGIVAEAYLEEYLNGMEIVKF